MPKIVIVDAYTANPGDLSWSAFEALGEVISYERTASEEIVGRCSSADIVLTNKVCFPAEILDQLPQLKYVGVLATGTNVIDLADAASRGITVTNVPGYSNDSVVQHVFAMILHFASAVAAHDEAVHEDRWVNSADFCFTLNPLHELAGKTLGIVGLGSIGRQVAAVATAFGMKVAAAHQSSMNRLELPYEVEWLPVDELFAKADFLSLNCPLTEKTAELVNGERLKLMKPSAILINTGRGPLINEADLAEALNSGTIAAAALDVLSSEPPAADNPLLTAKNCVITPHIAWASVEARGRLLDIAAANLKGFLAGAVQNRVN